MYVVADNKNIGIQKILKAGSISKARQAANLFGHIYVFIAYNTSK